MATSAGITGAETLKKRSNTGQRNRVNGDPRPGAGGQHVNKASTAIHLRFDIRASSLPEYVKERLLALHHHLVTADGVVIIKAQEYRSQELNREAALARLATLLRQATVVEKTRKATKPSKGARLRRLEDKVRKGTTKALRGKVLP